MIGRTLSHFKITAQLGKGGMGEVYRAEDTKLGREVALKVLPPEMAEDPERLARFKREARTLASVDHPNIITIYSVEEADGIHFVTMGLVEGKTLGELTPPSGMDLARFFEFAIPLTEALTAAHARGITHRDLKPANVMVDDEDHRVKVLDFGLAKQHATGGDLDETLLQTMEMTREGVVLGTVPYMSPEQAEGKSVDQRTDIFSLGIIFYEMITGSRPFQGDSQMRLLSAILTETPTPVSEVKADLPRHLDRILKRCLAKDPKERFQTARDVHTELKELAREIERGTAEIGAAPKAPTPVSINRRTLVVTAAVAVFVLGALGYWFKSGSLGSQGISSAAMITSIVALPSTVNLPAEHEYLTDAVPSTLTTQLSRLTDVDTKLPPTSVEYDALGRDTAAIVAAYKVSAYVTSTINPDGGGFLLDVKLIAAADRSVLWSDSYQVTQDDYLGLVRQAATSILAQIRPAASPPEAQPLTTSKEAEMALQRGKHYLNRYGSTGDERSFDLAKAAFENALEHDPGLALAAADIGLLYAIRTNYSSGPEFDEVAAEIGRWGRRAVELDPTEGVGWAILYNFEETGKGTLDHEARFELATRGAALAPDSFVAQNAVFLALEAGTLRIEAARELVRRFPLVTVVRLNAALDLLLLGEPQEALELAQEVLDLDPGHVWALAARAHALLGLERLEEAQATIEELAGAVSENSGTKKLVASLQWALASASASPAEQAAWDRWVSQSADGAGLVFFFAQSALLRSERAEDAVLELGINWYTWVYYDFLVLSPLLETQRRAPEFERQEPERRAGLERSLARLDAARARGELPAYLEQPLADLRERLGLFSPTETNGS